MPSASAKAGSQADRWHAADIPGELPVERFDERPDRELAGFDQAPQILKVRIGIGELLAEIGVFDARHRYLSQCFR